jgi:hypothetical protein
MDLKMSMLDGLQTEDRNVTDREFKSEVNKISSLPQSGSSSTNYLCTLCQKMICKKSWSSHMRNIHNKIFRCETRNCVSYFSTEAERQQHQSQVHVGWKKCIYRKSQCAKNKQICQVHKTDGLPRVNSGLKCVYCSKKCKSKLALYAHINGNHSRTNISGADSMVAAIIF